MKAQQILKLLFAAASLLKIEAQSKFYNVDCEDYSLFLFGSTFECEFAYEQSCNWEHPTHPCRCTGTSESGGLGWCTFKPIKSQYEYYPWCCKRKIKAATTVMTLSTSTLTTTTTKYCKLMDFLSPRMDGVVKIDPEFEVKMKMIDKIAQKCSVKLTSISGFRLKDRPLTGVLTNVKPAKRSNHFIGHAIDTNLRLSDGCYCNSTCMDPKNWKNPRICTNKINEVDCFINGVMSGGLKWGGTFTSAGSAHDWVHFDDRFNEVAPAKFDEKEKDFQENCINKI
jgi:hypothetical protein